MRRRGERRQEEIYLEETVVNYHITPGRGIREGLMCTVTPHEKPSNEPISLRAQTQRERKTVTLCSL